MSSHINKLIHYIKKYIFSDKAFYKKLWVLALPIIIQNFMASFLNIIDTVMIGQVGEIQIAAVGVANQYFLLCFLVIIGIHSGSSVLISQYWGKGDRENIKKVHVISLITAIACSVLLALIAFIFPEKIISIFNKEALVISEGGKYLRIVCISYIFTAITMGYAMASRSIGNALMPMVVSGIAIVFNTVFNYILIFGKFGAPCLGVEGAAIATVIARIVEVVVILFYIYTQNSILAVRLKDLSGVTREFLIKTFKTILPVVLNEGVWALGSVVRSIAYGRIGSHALAAVQICNTVQNLFNVAVFGMAAASAVMVGHKIGEGEEEQGQEYAWRFTVLSWIIGLVLGLILALTAKFILSFFKVSSQVYESALWMQYMTAIIMIFRVFVIVLAVGVLRGGGDAKFAFICESITMWFIGVPMAFIGAFALHLPIHLVVALSTIEELIKAYVLMKRLISKKWIKNLVHDVV